MMMSTRQNTEVEWEATEETEEEVEEELKEEVAKTSSINHLPENSKEEITIQLSTTEDQEMKEIASEDQSPEATMTSTSDHREEEEVAETMHQICTTKALLGTTSMSTTVHLQPEEEDTTMMTTTDSVTQLTTTVQITDHHATSTDLLSEVEEVETQEMEEDIQIQGDHQDMKSSFQEEEDPTWWEVAIEVDQEEDILKEKVRDQETDLKKRTDSWMNQDHSEDTEEEVEAEEEEEATSEVTEETVKKMTTTERLMFAEELAVVLAQKITEKDEYLDQCYLMQYFKFICPCLKPIEIDIYKRESDSLPLQTYIRMIQIH